jgi:hypothetical protein
MDGLQLRVLSERAPSARESEQQCAGLRGAHFSDKYMESADKMLMQVSTHQRSALMHHARIRHARQKCRFVKQMDHLKYDIQH